MLYIICSRIFLCTHTEYDAGCVSSHQANLTTLGIRVVTGDQSDVPTLHEWINQTGGNFDVIIDDGGHANHHIYNSFQVLFFKALKPGGAYFIEDLQVTRWADWRGTGDDRTLHRPEQCCASLVCPYMRSCAYCRRQSDTLVVTYLATSLTVFSAMLAVYRW